MGRWWRGLSRLRLAAWRKRTGETAGREPPGGAPPARRRDAGGAARPWRVWGGVATAIRSCVARGAGWAQNRLEPQVDQVVEVRLYDLTSQVELAAFDDPDFHDRMQRARDRGVYSASALV